MHHQTGVNNLIAQPIQLYTEYLFEMHGCSSIKSACNLTVPIGATATNVLYKVMDDAWCRINNKGVEYAEDKSLFTEKRLRSYDMYSSTYKLTIKHDNTLPGNQLDYAWKLHSNR